MKKDPKPTDSELEILQILWQNGENNVRFVNEKLNEKRIVGYTTTLKLLQIMTEKGLVQRELDGKTHLYKAAIKENEIRQALLDKLLDTAFGGSAMKLVVQALGNSKTSQEELNQIKSLIKDMEEEDGNN